MIKLYGIVLQNFDENSGDLLPECVRLANENFFDMLLVPDDDNEATEVEEEPRAQIKRICDAVMTTLEEDLQLYQYEFPPTIPVVNLAATTMRERLIEQLKPHISTYSLMPFNALPAS